MNNLVTNHSAVHSFPFKGKAGMGMGYTAEGSTNMALSSLSNLSPCKEAKTSTYSA